jgi:hypothetical protein
MEYKQCKLRPSDQREYVAQDGRMKGQNTRKLSRKDGDDIAIPLGVPEGGRRPRTELRQRLNIFRSLRKKNVRAKRMMGRFPEGKRVRNG